MFRRRHPRSLMAQARELAWPSAGWRRTLRYMGYRLARLPGTPNSIAMGLATGIAISFTPFVGLHLVLASAISWIMGGSILAAVAGTAMANPWTLPLIWLWIYYFGRLLLHSDKQMALPADLTFAFAIDHPWHILAPMTVGGLLTAAAVWALAYFPIRAAVAGYQQRRRARLHVIAALK
jgi:uncharacterized protein (DUF2062 family)